MQGNRLILILCLSIFSLESFAARDVKGSKDHPIVSRYPNTHIIAYEAKDFDEYVLPLSAPIKKGGSNPEFKKKKELEGKITRFGYAMKPTTSTLKIFRNFESAFKKSGFKIMFSCKKDACGQVSKWQAFFVKRQVWGKLESQRMMTAYKKINGQDVYLVLYTGAQGRRITIGLDVVEVKEMETDLVEVDEKNLQQKLESEGKVALYGIQFEVDKATLLDQSRNSIKVLADVLTKNSTIKVYIVGHTDDSGAPEHNISLSNKRAQAVVQELGKKYKIDTKRLTAFGAGPYAPVGNNANEEGRALNRRVEIIKRL